MKLFHIIIPLFVTQTVVPLRITNSCPDTIHITLEVVDTAILFNAPLTQYTFASPGIHKILLTSDMQVRITVNPINTHKILSGNLLRAKDMRPSDELVISYKIDGTPRVMLITEQACTEIFLQQSSIIKRRWNIFKNKVKGFINH